MVFLRTRFLVLVLNRCLKYRDERREVNPSHLPVASTHGPGEPKLPTAMAPRLLSLYRVAAAVTTSGHWLKRAKVWEASGGDFMFLQRPGEFGSPGASEPLDWML